LISAAATLFLVLPLPYLSLSLSLSQGINALFICNLSPAHDCLVPIGMGVHHSGVEILETEYSLVRLEASLKATLDEENGPSEIQCSVCLVRRKSNVSPGNTQQEDPDAKFRFQEEMGAFAGGIQ
jgi:hypothetical protein